jgi:hypothetical protein
MPKCSECPYTEGCAGDCEKEVDGMTAVLRRGPLILNEKEQADLFRVLKRN